MWLTLAKLESVESYKVSIRETTYLLRRGDMELQGYYYAVIHAETPKKALKQGALTHEWLNNYKAYLIRNPNEEYTELEALDLMFFDVKTAPRHVCRCYALGASSFLFFAKKTEHLTFQQHKDAYNNLKTKLRTNSTLSPEELQIIEYVSISLEKLNEVFMKSQSKSIG